MGVLFQRRLLDKYVQENLKNDIKNIVDFSTVKKWVDHFSGKTTLKESNLEQAFNEDFFIKILGYTGPPKDNFNFIPKQSATTGQNIPDFIIGDFQLEKGVLKKDIRRIVGELKGPNIDLDKINPSRKKTPVEQAFEYGRNNGIYVDWIIISNMVSIRLYKNSSMFDYEEFHVTKFINNGSLGLEFWKFYFLLHHDFLLKNAPNNQVYSLLADNIEERIKITEAFYNYYKNALNDVYLELCKIHKKIILSKEGQIKIARSARKLLHRGLMICFMSDHPDRILPKDLLNNILKIVKQIPTLNQNKIHSHLVDLFKCIDIGSPSYYPYRIFGYDGGLFHYHEIIDSISLPDKLYLKEYQLNGKKMEGIFGFREIDFYYEISPHILGRLFELSINEEEELFKALFDKDIEHIDTMNLQSDLGLVYTREVLANFCAESVLNTVFDNMRNDILFDLFGNKEIDVLNEKEENMFWKIYMEKLLNLKIVDIAVGSGAFLVSCYKVMRKEINKAYEMQKNQLKGLTKYFDTWETSLLDNCIYGKDIMPGAIEIAKLSLWLSSVKKNSKLMEFEDNFIVGDSLDHPIMSKKNIKIEDNYEKYDIVIGNPPWGAEIKNSAVQFLKTEFNEIENIENYDTFELFLLVGLKYLKEGGRLCYVLPHTILHSEKERIRKILIKNYTIEKWYNLGAEWFGPKIRMNTNILQLIKKPPDINNEFLSMVLVSEERKNAIKGMLDLIQIEKTLAHKNPQKRSLTIHTPVELFRFTSDDPIIEKIEMKSKEMGYLCNRYRGVELNKKGNLIQCPSCGKWIAPPRSKKNVPIEELEKICDYCKHRFLARDSLSSTSIISDNKNSYDEYYIDGDGMLGRYKELKYKGIKLGYDGVNYKDPEIYVSPKLFIREAGIGLSVSYDDKNAYCPRSIYIYKLKNEYKYIDHKYLLGILQSRTLSYYIFKKYGQIDAAQAFGKFTLDNVSEIPIPIKDTNDQEWKQLHNIIVDNVDLMLNNGDLGGSIDWQIERAVQKLYGISSAESAYIMNQLGLVAYHKSMQEMFPDGPPPKPRYVEKITLK